MVTEGVNAIIDLIFHIYLYIYICVLQDCQPNFKNKFLRKTYITSQNCLQFLINK